MMETIENALRKLTFTNNYKGFRCTVWAYHLIAQDENWLTSMKQLYEELGRQMKRSPTAIETNIGTVAENAWNMNGKELRRMARYDLHRRPTNHEFIEILYNYVVRSGEAGYTYDTPRLE